MKLILLDKHELQLGIEKESSEHGMSYDEARKTAIDHLKENPKYYSVADKAGLEEEDVDLDELQEWFDSIFTSKNSGKGRAGRVKRAVNKEKRKGGARFAPAVYGASNGMFDSE